MKLRLALVTGLILGTCGGARAEPAFSAFQNLCFNHNGSRPQALADADAAGWTSVPEAMQAKMPFGSEAEAPEWFLWRDFQGKHVALAPNDEKALAADAHVLIVYGNNQFAVVGLIAPIEVSPN